MPHVCSVFTSALTSCTVDGVIPSVGNNPPPVSIHGTVSAAASYGHLLVSEDLQSFPRSALVDQYFVTLGASFSDTLTVSGFSGSGFMQFGLDYNPADALEGTVAFTLNGAYVTFRDHTNQLFPFVAGSPFDLSLDFLFNSKSDVVGSCFCGTGAFGIAIDQIQLFDSSMYPINGYILSAASGTLYPAVGAAVPEPASILLLITYLGGSAAVLRRRGGTRVDTHY